jgi:hypothetical protein
MTRLAPWLLLVGAVLIAGAALLGFATVSRGGVSCGSAFAGSNRAAETQDYTNALAGRPLPTALLSEQCTSARATRRTLTYGVGGVGVLVLLVGGGVLINREWQEAGQPRTA